MSDDQTTGTKKKRPYDNSTLMDSLIISLHTSKEQLMRVLIIHVVSFVLLCSSCGVKQELHYDGFIGNNDRWHR